MSDFYDRYENRPIKARETALFRDLRALLKIARPRAPALRRQLGDIDIDALRTRADLARIPLIRKSDLKRLQSQSSPFGGLATTRPSSMKRLLASPGPIFDPEGYGKDWWGAARALYAAGLRKGDILLNTFSYHLTPGAHIIESGAHMLGCAVIPAGPGNVEQQLEAIQYLRPTFYSGTPDFLKILLDKADAGGIDASSIKGATVSGAALPASLRAELTARGVPALQSYGTADLGIIAYETRADDGLIVNEGVIVEIVRPGSGDPAPVGEVGEVVVTRINADYPLLRFATGDLSAVIEGVSTCGRTNMRLKGWLGRADQTTKVKGMFVHLEQIAGIGERHPELGKLRLVVSRQDEQDAMLLLAEGSGDEQAVADTLQSLTKLRGKVQFVEKGSLPNDGKIIVDERPVS